MMQADSSLIILTEVDARGSSSSLQDFKGLRCCKVDIEVNYTVINANKGTLNATGNWFRIFFRTDKREASYKAQLSRFWQVFGCLATENIIAFDLKSFLATPQVNFGKDLAAVWINLLEELNAGNSNALGSVNTIGYSREDHIASIRFDAKLFPVLVFGTKADEEV
jgi:hypothetical protein